MTPKIKNNLSTVKFILFLTIIIIKIRYKFCVNLTQLKSEFLLIENKNRTNAMKINNII